MSTDLPYFVEGEFVLEPEAIEPERHGNVDLYIPKSEGPFPAVILEPGGPLPEDADWNDPREWSVYHGYGSLLAAHGIVAGLVKLPLYDGEHFPRCAKVLAESVDAVRADDRVDADRMGIWFWCAGGPLVSSWLREAPPWLRVLALTYPSLGAPDGVELPAGFEPSDALAEARELPRILLGRAALEAPAIAKTVEKFVMAAEKHQVPLEIIDVATGFHGYDIVNHAQKKVGNPPPGAVRPDFDASMVESRAAVNRALDFVRKALQ
ncbi:alpha/beta hydrolase [Nonomuraea sp. K274]|uniref:Alpha/beta hydrolase n=1 Tax=Nonomuraea cypriaca TaxID=1187855 RepID=A0A931A487_9ACTN|nr:alpha/beta hydrolase [Nonomuraea cypriaca]MBF8184509.1 alpha/beta hydrolase [Nonomuraea cypriaca]